MRYRPSIRLAFVFALLCSLMVSFALARQPLEHSSPPEPVAFEPAVNYTTARAAVMSAAGDFNGDGAPDLATNHWGDHTLVIQLNDGAGVFSVKAAYPSSAGGFWAIDTGDLNQDDKLDLVVAGRADNQLLIYLGVGDGTFVRGTTLAVSPDSLDVKLGDFNGDGRLDAVITSKTFNAVEVRLGRGDGTFQAGAIFGVGSQPCMLHLADLNGDDRLDIVTANSGNASVLLGDGAGSFQPAVNYPAPAGSRSPAVGDINGDGWPDLAVAGSQTAAGQVDLFLGDGAGRFTPHSSLPIGAPGMVVLRDINHDGKTDMLVSQASGGSTAPGAVSVFLGNGDATFQPVQAFQAGINPATLLVRDVNGDNWLDIVTSNYHGYDVSVLLAVPAVAAPAAKVYLPLAFDPLLTAFPIAINPDPIPVRPVERQGEIFYSADIRVPGPLPA
ncbi:MAG TPA: VCBS repeat-containing protein, partial [Herpetosiphonaceae bacterium]